MRGGSTLNVLLPFGGFFRFGLGGFEVHIDGVYCGREVVEICCGSELQWGIVGSSRVVETGMKLR